MTAYWGGRGGGEKRAGWRDGVYRGKQAILGKVSCCPCGEEATEVAGSGWCLAKLWEAIRVVIFHAGKTS